MIDSKKDKISNRRIIEIASHTTKSKYTPEQVLVVIAKEIKLPGVIVSRYGNTLFLTHKTHPRFGFFRALNGDTAQNYVENSKQFCVDLYKKGFDMLVTQFSDPSILQVFRAISRNPPNEHMGYSVQQQGSEYQVTLALGKKRGEQ